mgnify:CR=1 FL=1
MFTNKKSLLALSVASTFALTGCFSDDDNNKPVPDGGGDGGDGGVVIVAPEAPAALDFVISGSVVENEEFNVLSNATVKFMENSEPSTNIVAVDGSNAQTLTNAGSFVVTLKEGADLDNVTAIVSAEGYISKVFNVDLTNEDDFDVLTAQFILFTGDSDEVKQEVVNKTLTSATTSEEIVADAQIGTKSLASATLPSGTTLQNAQGETVAAGELSLSVLGLDPTSDTKGSVIPEGLNANNTSGNVAVPVSLADITMTVGGTKVKNFSGDTLKVTLAAPSDLDAGETLTVKSLDEDTGVWEDESFVVTKGTGTVSFETDHLTWFSVNKSAAACSTGLSTTVTGDAVPAGGLLFVAASSDGLGISVLPEGATSEDVFSGIALTRYGFSEDAMAEVYVFDNEGGLWFESDGEVGVCGTVPVELTRPYEVVSKTLTLSGVCAQDNSQAVDVSNSVVTYNRENKRGKSVLKNADGNFDLSGLRAEENYQVTVNFRGLPLVGSNTFTLENVDDSDVSQQFEFTCNEVTGSGGSGGSGGTGG